MQIAVDLLVVLQERGLAQLIRSNLEVTASTAEQVLPRVCNYRDRVKGKWRKGIVETFKLDFGYLV